MASMLAAERVFEALGDRTRRSIFLRLRDGEHSVGDLARGMDVSRPAVSQHLRVLKEAQLVVDRAAGTRRLYAIDRRGVVAARRWLEGVWNDALGAFKAAAEQEAAQERKR